MDTTDTNNTHQVSPVPDAIDELVSRSMDCEELQKFHRAHRANPEVLDFLVAAIRLRIGKGTKAFSFQSLFDYCRWKIDGACLDDHNAPYYARAVLILHPEFNGQAAFKKSRANDVFGLEFEAGGKRPDCYARRLEWADGVPLEKGWRPSRPHVVNPEVVYRYQIH